MLANMEDIERARGLGWGWNEIAKELGVESSGAVRKAYVRIKKRIDSGKLKIPGKDQQKNRKEERKEEKKESPGPGGPAPEKGPGPRLITKQPGGGTDFFENLPKA